ncbi:PREDICTED: TNF receptor-associated factor 2-like isoform X2 [Branchiostoma belcheri]|uniref:TNF receptor-associated factor 2-like isoform X2 n=1 Tax=Branchiostoma belcheri TaxID=7741 RepID=A0A6P4Y4F6_BRABE|nr:PREDICTED: TNF receptor-associated factor 2-like isoform X2 [Branchiostoma belcheri]
MPGFSVKIKGEGTDPKYCCSSCNLLLNEPRQTSCGHRYCKSCLDYPSRGRERFQCKVPICGQQINTENVFPDKAIEREIQSIEVFCNNDDDGCKWEGLLKELKIHLAECGYEKIACIHQDCGERFPRRDLSKHLTDNCASAACQWYPFKDIAKHQESCPMAPARCGWCGKKGLTRAQLQDHQHPQSGDCPNMKLPCHFEPVGCKEKLERKQHGDHQKKAITARHLAMLLLLATHLEGLVLRDQDIGSRENMRAAIPRLDKDQGSKIAQLEQNVSAYQSEGATASGSGSSEALENRVEQIRAKVEDAIKKLAAWEPRVGTFEGIVAVLNREIEKCSSQMEAYERQRRQDREIIETLERKVRSLERIIALKDVALAEQDLRIQTLELTSYDGILTWKIPDFIHKRHDAITGRTRNLYSPCFFTSRTGYKMCARIYLNGDGMGKGTHVSLFFVVMRGHFDGLLRWPFRQKVTFMLLDQNNREHVIDAFRPDPTSSSFQRPTSDMNIASGCPLFVPLSQLESSSHAYVRDDTMYLRVIVDTSDLN